MKHICYIYVYKYKMLEGIGIAFNPDYTYCMKENVLTIETAKNKVPAGFWGEHISSLSALIGENGSGKSTTLELLFHILTDGAASDDVQAAVVYEQEDRLHCFVPSGHDIQIEGLACDKEKVRPKLCSMYYTGYFSPYFSYEYPRDNQLTGSFNMSDGYLMIRDLQDYSNVDTLHLTEPLGNHLLSHIAQDNFRITCLLADSDIRDSLKTYTLPRYLFIVPNKSGYNAIRRNQFGNYKNLDIPDPKWSLSAEQNLLALFIYHNFLDVIAEEKSEESVAGLNEWLNAIGGSNDVLHSLLSVITDKGPDEKIADKLHRVYYVLLELKNIASYSEKYGSYYIDTKESSVDLKEWMQRVYLQSGYLVARCFDIEYSKTLNPYMRLSTGELVVLKLFSRLYYALALPYNRFTNLEEAELLLIDEAEIGLHPEWQRTFANSLVEFVNVVMRESDKKIQIVLASHSPFVLSDIPTNCATFLQVGMNEIEEPMSILAVMKGNTTFGANLYDLIKDGYFLSNSIGEFAQHKIQDFYRVYNAEGKDQEAMFLSGYEEFKFVVDSIADPLIAQDAKSKFYQLCRKYKHAELREQLEREILERQQMLAVL